MKIRYKGFTLLEVLLSITLIGILASIALIAINPNRQLGQSRDLGRQDDITKIQQALEIYASKNSGVYPSGLESGPYKEICGDVPAANCVDLSVLVPDYLNSIPKDPNGNNYLIGINPENQNVSIWAKEAEQREVSINKFLLAGKKENGFAGTPLGFNGSVRVITVQPNDKILIGGPFENYQGVLANRVIRLNSNGSRDTTFDSGTGFDNQVSAIEVQPDGKILVGGTFENYQGVLANRVIRLNSNGSRDTTFDIGTGFDNQVSTIAVQPDGKILVGGAFENYQGVLANRVIRLNSNGSRDTAFDIGTAFNNQVSTIAVQPDNKIIVGGVFTTYQGVVANRSVRLNNDGSIDNTFNIGVGFNNQISNLKVQSDGKIIVVGSFTNYQGVSANRIIRLNTDGSRDNSFNVGTGLNGNVNNLVIQLDGKVLVGGIFTSYQGVSANRIIRLNTDGNIDTSFNTGTGFNTSTSSQPTQPLVGFSSLDNNIFALAIQTDGKILVGGNFSSYQEIGSNYIVRLISNGSRDITFNTGTSFESSVRIGAIQADGKLVVGGSFTTYQGLSANRIVRLNSDGTRDSSFNIDSGFNITVNAIAIQSDGKILVGGWFTTYQGLEANKIIRLNSDGSRDTDFNMGTGFNARFIGSRVSSISVQTDGKILVSGPFESYQGVSANRIVRLNSDGSRDTSFNVGTGFNNTVNALSIQSDGKILVGGIFSTYQGLEANKIIRLNSDGSRDTSFNIGTGFDAGNTNLFVNSMFVQTDGKVLVGGTFESYQGVLANRIIRLNSDGSIDTSFNIGNGFNNSVNALSIQSDGKILVGGSFTTYQGVSANRIIRLNVDGSKDTDFNIDPSFSDNVNAFVIQSDAKLLVAAGNLFRIYLDNIIY